MPIVFPCPTCQKQLSAPDNAVGKTARCKACSNTCKVPAASTSARPATVTSAPPSSGSTESIQLTCSSCGKNLRAPATAQGKKVKCVCGAIQPVPLIAPVAAEASNSWLDTLPNASNSQAAATPISFDSAPQAYPASQPYDPYVGSYGSGQPTGNSGYSNQGASGSSSMANMYLSNAAAETSRDTYVERGESWNVNWAKIGGGLLMMLGAVVWFFLGLAAGRIFFYPPILFIIGLIAVVKGFFDGE